MTDSSHPAYGVGRGVGNVIGPGLESVGPDTRFPSNFVELVELRAAAVDHRLGYFRSERFVIFGYCPGGAEVIWKDSHSSGFGAGGWRIFLDEIAPLGARFGINLGDMTNIGTHVLLMDRRLGAAYAAPREAAEDFLARASGVPPPTRPCLCAHDGPAAACPIHGCSEDGDG